MASAKVSMFFWVSQTKQARLQQKGEFISVIIHIYICFMVNKYFHTHSHFYFFKFYFIFIATLWGKQETEVIQLMPVKAVVQGDPLF